MKATRAAALVVGLLMTGVAYAAPTPAPVPPPQPTVTGLWAQSDDTGEVGAWFLFTEKDAYFQGRLVKMFPKPGEPSFDVCTKCTGDQKNARMLGLTMIDGMKRYGLEYKDGNILDPRDGSVYHAQMELSPDGKTLAVRGYLFVPLLGQTQTWHRLPDDALAPQDVPKEVLATPAAVKH